MDKKHIDILTNIIGGVETGGQIYGNRNYASYAGLGKNTANEKTCTLGWAGNYGERARKLCRMILERDPAAFRKADTAGIEQKLSVNWETTQWHPTTAQKNALIAIITTDAGKTCQDELFQEMAQNYIKYAEEYGVTDIPSQMMWCEIEHMGGLKPVKRIFGRAEKPYTPDSIFTSLLLDQKDTSSNNQVGDKIFQSRHECCVRWIKQYVEDAEKETAGMTEREARLKVVNIMNGWIGLKRSDGSHMVILDIYNKCLPLPRGYKVKQNDAYCATGASAAAIKAGFTDIIPRECSCGHMIELFDDMGRWVENDAYVPDLGDYVFYYWKDGENYAATDCTGWPDHVGIVAEVHKDEGYMVITECNMSGGVVGQRKLEINGRYIRGYGIPDYASKAGISSGESDSASSGGTTSNSSTGGINKTPQWVGQITAESIPVRTWAGDSYEKIKSWPTLGKDNLVDVCDTIKASNGHIWYYILIARKFYGFVDSLYIKRADSSSGSGTTAAPSYTVGQVYTLQVELRVRTAAGTNSPTKSYSQFTADGQRHDKDKDGCLDVGTQVTCQAVQNVGNDIWIKVPSGWLAAYYQNQEYIK